MPCQGPDDAFVSCFDATDLLISSIDENKVTIRLSSIKNILPNIPEENLTVGTARREKSLVNRMPSHRTRLLLMTPERLQIFFKITQIEQL